MSEEDPKGITDKQTPQEWKGVVFTVSGKFSKKQDYISELLSKLGLVSEHNADFSDEPSLCIVDKKGYKGNRSIVKQVRKADGKIMKESWVQKLDAAKGWVDPQPEDYWDKPRKLTRIF